MSALPVMGVSAELYATTRFKERTDGQRVIMYHDGIERAAEIVAAADDHLAELETLLNRPILTRVRWIRATVLGQAVSFGASALSDAHDEERLRHVDRHELAHAAINQHMTPSSRPPMVLVEGFAEAVAEPDSGKLAATAAHGIDYAPSLKQLVRPPWAWQQHHPVYDQGGLFVDLLLKAYGGEKFLELYTTCRPETFEADFQRVMAVDFNELERRYNSQVREWSKGRRIRDQLAKLPLGDEVDADAWRTFVERYAAAVDATDLPAEYEAEIIVEAASAPTEEAQLQERTNRYRDRVVGDSRLIALDDEILCVTDQRAFRLRRQPNQKWQLAEKRSVFPEVEVWLMRQTLAAEWTSSFRSEFDPHPTANWDVSPPRVTAFAWKQDNDDSLAHIILQSAAAAPYLLQMTLSQAAGLRQVHRTEQTDGKTVETTVDWEFADGKLVGFRDRTEQFSADAKVEWSHETNFQIRQPPLASEGEFELSHYGVAPRATWSMSWAQLLLAVCLALGGIQFALGLTQLRHRRT